MKEIIYCDQCDKKFNILFEFFYRNYHLFKEVSSKFSSFVFGDELVCLSKALSILKNRDINLYELFREMIRLDPSIKDEEYGDYFYFLLRFYKSEYTRTPEIRINFLKPIIYLIDIDESKDDIKDYSHPMKEYFDDLLDIHKNTKTIQIWKNELLINKEYI